MKKLICRSICLRPKNEYDKRRGNRDHNQTQKQEFDFQPSNDWSNDFWAPTLLINLFKVGGWINQIIWINDFMSCHCYRHRPTLFQEPKWRPKRAKGFLEDFWVPHWLHLWTLRDPQLQITTACLVCFCFYEQVTRLFFCLLLFFSDEAKNSIFHLTTDKGGGGTKRLSSCINCASLIT